MNKLLLINKTELPHKTEHICYYVRTFEDNYYLVEVVENWYSHPEAKDDTYIQMIETRTIKKVHKNDNMAVAELVLLQAAQNNCRTINKE